MRASAAAFVIDRRVRGVARLETRQCESTVQTGYIGDESDREHG